MFKMGKMDISENKEGFETVSLNTIVERRATIYLLLSLTFQAKK